MKYILSLLTLSSLLIASNINESLLKVHASIVPKISLMDYKFQEKIKNNTLTIAILYKPNMYQDALSLKNKIESKYAKGLKSFKVLVTPTPYTKLHTVTANILYLFPSSSQDITEATKQAQEINAITFSYEKDDLRYGVMISLEIGIKIKPILNLRAIKEHNISFRPTLLQISNIYNLEEGS